MISCQRLCPDPRARLCRTKAIVGVGGSRQREIRHIRWIIDTAFERVLSESSIGDRGPLAERAWPEAHRTQWCERNACIRAHPLVLVANSHACAWASCSFRYSKMTSSTVCQRRRRRISVQCRRARCCGTLQALIHGHRRRKCQLVGRSGKLDMLLLMVASQFQHSHCVRPG